jgi:hypothetical protein
MVPVSEPVQASPVMRLRQVLAGKANESGGWGYYSGKSSRVEPTSWALLALADTWDGEPAAWQRFAAPHLEFLKATQRDDGLLVDVPHAPPNFTANGVAACVLASREGGGPAIDRLIDGLVGVKGISVNAPDPRQDNKLQGWPWMPDTFSWLEPTCWCVLALKKTRARTRKGVQARIDEADKLILNRSCEAGGWNFGNASALGQDLRPYVPTTALGLIALQDRQAEAVVGRSLAYLTQARVKEPSAMALALTALCLRIYDRPADDVEARLADDADRAERTGNLQALAMMLYALSVPTHAARALRVEDPPRKHENTK